MGAVDLSDVQDGILPCFALMLAVRRLGVLGLANVRADVVALVRCLLVRPVSAVVVRGVIAGVPPLAAAIHHCTQVRKRILDLIDGLLELLNGALHSGLAIHTDLDGGTANANAVVVVNHHGSSVDVLGREASCDAEVVDRRRHGTLNHVAHILPRIFSIELLVPVVATDGVGVRAGRALVDVNATAVGVGALSLRAPGVQALREQPAEGLRCVVRLDLQGLGDRSLAVRLSCHNESRNTGHSHPISH